MNFQTETIYKEFRSDGWPLCPACEEDELYSVKMLNWLDTNEKLTIEDCLQGEMTCYRCNWTSVNSLEKICEFYAQ